MTYVCNHDVHVPSCESSYISNKTITKSGYHLKFEAGTIDSLRAELKQIKYHEK